MGKKCPEEAECPVLNNQHVPMWEKKQIKEFVISSKWECVAEADTSLSARTPGWKQEYLILHLGQKWVS